ncbi:MAG: stage II sporulation protein R [Clostridiales bacterium]|nr:stage II sporulation protein R [Clostridiales bacterium]
MLYAKRKPIEAAVFIGLVLALLLSLVGFDAHCGEIRENVLRLHVLANSDSEADQALKLRVRDRVLQAGEEIFAGKSTEAEALEAARANIALLQAAAEEEIAQSGYGYPVRVEVGPSRFDTRVYDDFTLPAGEYEAVRVLIGEAAGHNWWCVMFPAVCLPAAEKREDLSQVLEGESLKIVEEPAQFTFRFKAVEVYEGIRDKIQSWF